MFIYLLFMSTVPTDQVITIKEAAEKYNKAEITIRRLIRSIVKDESSDDRAFIHPKPAEVQKLKKKQKPFTYSVDQVLLDKIYGEVEKVKEAKAQNAAASSNTSVVPESEYFDLLKQQLAVKDEQIKSLHQSLDEMTVRSRETVGVMKMLQENMTNLPTSLEKKIPDNVVEANSDKKGHWWFW